MRNLRFLLLIYAWILPSSAFACGANCDFNCGRLCANVVGVRVCTQPLYDQCLASERVCDASNKAANALCRTNRTYWDVMTVVREAKNSNLIRNQEECRDQNHTATVFAAYAATPAAAFIADTCGCYLCEEAFRPEQAKRTPVGPTRKRGQIDP